MQLVSITCNIAIGTPGELTELINCAFIFHILGFTLDTVYSISPIMHNIVSYAI
jgi:hypothetical protein